MTVFMVQVKYESTKTWLVEGHDEEFVRAQYDSGVLEMEFGADAAISTEHSGLQAITKVEGKISKSMAPRVLKLNLEDPRPRPFDQETD